jgi:glutamate synthase (NADPH/NADH) small chain
MLRLREGGERIPLTVADFDRRARHRHHGRADAGAHHPRDARRLPPGRRLRTSSARSACPSTSAGRPRRAGRRRPGRGAGLPAAARLPEAGNRTTCIVGFRSAELQFWDRVRRQWSDELIVCTDDGSAGRAGPGDRRPAGAARARTAARPGGRHRADADDAGLCRHHPPLRRATLVSLNTIMVDGTGMCGSCRVTVDGQVRFACVDGPDFDATRSTSTS